MSLEKPQNSKVRGQNKIDQKNRTALRKTLVSYRIPS